jgi:hypothetical protein
MPRDELVCATYDHPHKGKNCRCLKLCTNCGHTESEHRTKYKSPIFTIAELKATKSEHNPYYDGYCTCGELYDVDHLIEVMDNARPSNN